MVVAPPDAVILTVITIGVITVTFGTARVVLKEPLLSVVPVTEELPPTVPKETETLMLSPASPGPAAVF